MQTNASNKRKSFKALVGAAHHALRAYAKALEAQSGNKEPFRYHVPLDGKTGFILDGKGETIMQRPIEDWAQEGPRVRWTMIGLRSFKEEIELATRRAGDRARVRYDLSILDNSAWLTMDGNRLHKDALDGFVECLNLSARVRELLPSLTDEDLQNMDGWAKLGRQAEIDYFLDLEAAESYGSASDVETLREKGVRLGIIRRRPEEIAGSPDEARDNPAPVSEPDRSDN